MRFSLKAADYYKRVGKDLNVRYALVAAARAMLASREIQRGVQLLDSILALANAERDSGLALQCYEGLLLASVVKHDYINGFRYFDEYRKNPYCVYDYEDDVSYLYLQVYSGDTTGVKSAIESIRPLCKSDREKARLANLEYETAKLLANPEYIVSSADSLRKHTDGYLEEGIINSVSSAERDFYSGKAESESKVRHNQLSVAMICIIVVVILAVVIAIAFRKRLKHRNELIVRKQRDIDTLNNTLEYNIDQKQQLENRVREKEEVIASLISMLDDLSKSQTQDGVSTDSLSSKEAYIEKWTLFNSLFDDYFRMHDSSASVSRQLRPFTDFVSRIQSKEYLDKIRQSVDKYMGGIVTRLIDECPWLKEEDILLLTLSYAGISPRAIALIMNMQLRSMYNKRNRLIKLIIKNCPPDAAEFTDIPKPIASE